MKYNKILRDLNISFDLKEGVKLTNVFIDTQVFVHKNFNFNNDLIQKLVNASVDGLITIYITDVVKDEIESKIYEQVYEKVKNIQKKFSTESKILKNLNQYENVFLIHDKLDEIYQELLN